MALSDFLEAKIVVFRIFKRLKGLTASDTVKLFMCAPIVYILLKMIFKVFRDTLRCCFLEPSLLIASFRLININRVICRISRDLQVIIRPEDIDAATLSREPEARDIFNPEHGDVVIDVGAHIGSYTVRAARMVGRGGLVIAIEPDPENFKLLMLNIKLNDLNNVITLPYAASDKNGKVILHRSLFPGLCSITRIPRRFAGDVEVRCITIDNIVNKFGIRKIDWIKIDVEGAEVDVLRGARRALSLTENIIIEVWYENLDKVLSILREEDYAMKILRRIDGDCVYIYAKKCSRKRIEGTIGSRY